MSDQIQQLKAPGFKSISLYDDGLIDWVRGGTTLYFDGRLEAATVRYAYRFDAAVVSPCGRYAVIYERLGTKGLVLREGKLLREINRSFYYADTYEYPVVLFQSQEGRVLIAHCPKDYCRLDIEDAETGECLTENPERRPGDVFHSRLRVSPDGKWLISAGWVWHPWGWLEVFNVDAALRDPCSLDRSVPIPHFDGEIADAAFLPTGEILVATSEESASEETENDAITGPNCLAIFTPGEVEVSSGVRICEPIGTLMPLDHELAVGFYGHPKLYSLKTGAIVKRWDGIASGDQNGSIMLDETLIPPVAYDSCARRFAVAAAEHVSVVLVPTAASLKESVQD